MWMLQDFPPIWSKVWIALPKTTQIRVINWVFGMNTRLKVFASYNILQYVFHFIIILMFVKVSKCPKNLNLTNIVFMNISAYLVQLTSIACIYQAYPWFYIFLYKINIYTRWLNMGSCTTDLSYLGGRNQLLKLTPMPMVGITNRKTRTN